MLSVEKIDHGNVSHLVLSFKKALFIYTPIGLAMVSNLVMFGVCIYKMYHEEEELHRREERVELIERQNSEQKRSIERKSSDLFAGIKETRNVVAQRQVDSIRRRKIAQVSGCQTFHLHRKQNKYFISLPLGT